MKAMIVGFGKMGMLHAATLRMLGVSDLVVCDTSPIIQRGIRAFAPQAQWRVVGSYHDVLREQTFDVAVIATPTASHGTIFRDLAGRVGGIFVEKPFCTSSAAAQDAIGSLPEHARAGVTVGHCLRFSVPFMLAKRLLDSNAIGAPRQFQATMFSSDVLRPVASWRSRAPDAGGGVLLDLGSHVVDMARALLGTPTRLRGQLSSVVSKDTEDAFQSEWTTASWEGTLQASWSKPDIRKPTLEIRVTGDRGELVVSDDALDLSLSAPVEGFGIGSHHLPITQLEQSVPFDLAGPMYTRQLSAWLSAVRNGTPASNGLDENLENLKLIDLIRRSNGQVLEVSS